MKFTFICLTTFICVASASAQNLTADYQFNNVYTSSVSGAPNLVETGSGQSFADDTVRGVPRRVLQFPVADGLALTPTTNILSNSGVYTIAVLFRFDNDSGYRRIIDFKNNGEDNGLYYLNGQLDFFSYDGSTIDVPANVYALVVLTRDTSGILRGYVNGVLALSADDSGEQHGVIDSNNKLIFFKDDGGEDSAGAVSRIRIWDGVLTHDQIAALSAQTIFKINSLTANNTGEINTESQIVDDRGGIAVSRSKALLTGDGQMGVYNRSDLSGAATASPQDSMVTNLHSQVVYVLADSNGNPVGNGCTGGTVSKLVMLDPDTGALTSNVITLSSSISLTDNQEEAGLFSGWDRVVVVDGSDQSSEAVYNIDLPSGVVTQVGTITGSAANYHSRSGAECWATHGVAEFFDGVIHLAFMQGGDFPFHIIGRVNVSDSSEGVVADIAPFDFSDGHEFTVVPTLGRWYLHYECCSPNPIGAGNSGEPLVFADATFTIRPQALYAADGAGQNSSCHLYILNPDDGSVAQDIGTIHDNNNTVVSITALAFDPNTRVLYAGSGSSGSYPRGRMFTLDPGTGLATLLGSEGTAAPLADITFTSDATLYGWGEGSDDLYTVDRTNGTTTKVAESNFSTAGSGISANSADVLYFGGNGPSGFLLIVDRFTGQVSNVAPFTGAPLPDAQLNAFAFDANDILFASNGGNSSGASVAHLVTINTTTAAITDLGASLNKLDAIAFEPAFCDSNPPVITVPNDIVTDAKSKKGKRVNFQVSAVDPEDGPVTATADPPSGTLFPNGRTTVTVTATDHCGNTATATFVVTVDRKTRRH